GSNVAKIESCVLCSLWMSVHSNGLKPESVIVAGAPGSASGAAMISTSGSGSWFPGGGGGGPDPLTTSNGTVISSSASGSPGTWTVQWTVSSCMPAANWPKLN